MIALPCWCVVCSCMAHLTQIFVRDAMISPEGAPATLLLRRVNALHVACRSSRDAMARLRQLQEHAKIAESALKFPKSPSDTRWHGDLLVLESARDLDELYRNPQSTGVRVCSRVCIVRLMRAACSRAIARRQAAEPE